MLEWKVKTGDEKLKESIHRCKETFESWFNNYWAHKCTRETMLSDKSPVEHVYYKMTKTFNEIKQKYPYEAKECCSSCGDDVYIWIETSFSFCDEYGCRMKLCKKCAKNLSNMIDKLLK